MKKLVILFCFGLLICPSLYGQEESDEIDELDSPNPPEEIKKLEEKEKKPEGPRARINNNYLGLNFVYNSATLADPNIDPKVSNSGFGGDLYYQSFIINPVSYKIQFGFQYNPFTIESEDILKDYALEPGRTDTYTRDEVYYNYSIGFIINYHLLFKETFGIQTGFLEYIVPYFSTGMMASFIFRKTIAYNYEEDPIPFTSHDDYSRSLASPFAIPLGFGFNFILGTVGLININVSYVLIQYDETEQNFAYGNMMNFKFGYAQAISFRL